MPPARKSSRSSSRRGTSFKEPAALKRLNKAIVDAEKALKDLRTQAGGSDAAAGTRTLYKGLGKFLSDARRDSGKFTTAIKKDFEQAAKAAQSAAKTATGGTSRRRSSTSTKKSSGSSRSTGSSTRRASSSSRGSGSSTRRSGSSSRSSSSRSSSRKSS
jgi:hypothetical protein